MLKVKKLHAEAIIPAYQSEGAAGFDLCATHEVVVHAQDREMVGTGLAFEVPPGFELQVRPRSGLALRHGITVLNTPGTVDSDFRGEVKVILFNSDEHRAFKVEKGMRIAQAVLAPVSRASIVEVEELSSTERGGNGFGSTGLT